MATEVTSIVKQSIRKRAKEIKPYLCKNLVFVLEVPNNFQNIGAVVRNAYALGVGKIYIVDPHRHLPDEWQDMRTRKSINRASVSAIKWTYVKRFNSAEDCIPHLKEKRYVSVVTSPHAKGKEHRRG